MSSPERWQRQTLIVLFRAALREMLDELVDSLTAAGYEARSSHSPLFENIDADGTRLTVLAERAEMTHPSMSELVTNIERLGYVERVPDPTDGRARLVRLTPAGRDLQRRALTEIAAIEADWQRRLGPTVGAGLRDALVAALGKRITEPADSGRGG